MGKKSFALSALIAILALLIGFAGPAVEAADPAPTASPTTSLPAPSTPSEKSAPSSLTLTSVSSTSAVLRWVAPTIALGSGATTYDIEISYDMGQSWTLRSTQITNSYFLTGLDPAKKYTVRVRAKQSAIISEPSAPVEFTTKTLLLPGSPIALSVTNVTNTSALLRWAKPAEIGEPSFSKYVIQLSQDSGINWSTTESSSTTKHFVNLAKDTDYAARVYSKSSLGQSTTYAQINFRTTSIGTPKNLVNLKGKYVLGGVLVNWNLMTGDDSIKDTVRLYAVKTNGSRVTCGTATKGTLSAFCSTNESGAIRVTVSNSEYSTDTGLLALEPKESSTVITSITNSQKTVTCKTIKGKRTCTNSWVAKDVFRVTNGVIKQVQSCISGSIMLSGFNLDRVTRIYFGEIAQIFSIYSGKILELPASSAGQTVQLGIFENANEILKTNLTTCK